MAKKNRVVTPPRAPTRRQLSRWQRERRLQRLAIIGITIVLCLIVAIPAYGYYREEFARGTETVLRVDDRNYTMNEYYRLLKLRDSQLEQTLAVLGRDNPQIEQFIQQQRLSLPMLILEGMVEDELIRQQAPRAGLAATPDDVTQMLRDAFQRKPAEGEQVDENKLREEADRAYRETLEQVGWSDQEYRDLIIMPRVLRDKLDKQLREQVPASGEQVHLLAIAVDKEDEAKDIRAKLAAGEDFAKLAAEHSKDTASKEKGGDLGWNARGVLPDEVEEAAFKLQVGELSQPVLGPAGYYVLRLAEREANRPIEASQLENLKGQALRQWLDKEHASDQHKIERFFDSDRQLWAMGKLGRERASANRRAPR